MNEFILNCFFVYFYTSKFLFQVMEVHKEKERSLYPMLPFIQPRPSCSNMISLLEDKSKRVAAEIAATLSQLESRKMEADQMKLTSGTGFFFKPCIELSVDAEFKHFRGKSRGAVQNAWGIISSSTTNALPFEGIFYSSTDDSGTLPESN